MHVVGEGCAGMHCVNTPIKRRGTKMVGRLDELTHL